MAVVPAYERKMAVPASKCLMTVIQLQKCNEYGTQVRKTMQSVINGCACV